MSVICCPIIGVLCMAFYFFGYVLFFVVYFDFGLITYLVLIVSRFVPFSACLVAILLRASMRFSRQKYEIDAEASKWSIQHTRVQSQMTRNQTRTSLVVIR